MTEEAGKSEGCTQSIGRLNEEYSGGEERQIVGRAVAEPYGQRTRIGADEVCVVMCSGRCITESG